MSHSGTRADASKIIGTDVSRIRKHLIHPLDKNVKVLKNPTTQIEIETLRAQRKVAGGGMIDPSPDRLISSLRWRSSRSSARLAPVTFEVQRGW